jgi:glycosyltransferase involved in cell wall biosynthesis
MTEPLVSVVIPTYNMAYSILDAVSTVATQTYENLQIIVVDDGSTDDTIRLLEAYQMNESRLKIIRQSHAGVSAARNRGIGEAQGEYIAFLDADDKWLQQKVACQLAEMLKSSSELCLCICAVIRQFPDNKRPPRITPAPKTLEDFATKGIFPSTWMVSRGAFREANIGFFDENLHFSEDADWLFRFLRGKGEMRATSDQPLTVRAVPQKNKYYTRQFESIEGSMQKHGLWIKAQVSWSSWRLLMWRFNRLRRRLDPAPRRHDIKMYIRFDKPKI